jgi:hypothetical protein
MHEKQTSDMTMPQTAISIYQAPADLAIGSDHCLTSWIRDPATAQPEYDVDVVDQEGAGMMYEYSSSVEGSRIIWEHFSCQLVGGGTTFYTTTPPRPPYLRGRKPVLNATSDTLPPPIKEFIVWVRSNKHAPQENPTVIRFKNLKALPGTLRSGRPANAISLAEGATRSQAP